MAHTITFVDSPLTQFRISIPIYIQGTGRHSLTHSPRVVVAAINLLSLTRADTCPLRSSTSPSRPFGFRFRKRNGRLFLIRLVTQILPFLLHNSFFVYYSNHFSFSFCIVSPGNLTAINGKRIQISANQWRINKQVSGAENPWWYNGRLAHGSR